MYIIYIFGAVAHGTYFVGVCAHDEYGRLGAVTGDGAEPKVEAGVFVAQANVPQQHVDRAIRQKELKQ